MIIPEDINTPEQELFRGLVTSSSKVISLDPYKIQIDLAADNKLGKDLKGHLEWVSKNFGWQVDLHHEHVDLAKDAKYQKSVVLTYTGKPNNVQPYPALEIILKDEEDRVFAAQAKVGITEILAYYKKNKVELTLELKKAKNKYDKKQKQLAKVAARQKQEDQEEK